MVKQKKKKSSKRISTSKCDICNSKSIWSTLFIPDIFRQQRNLVGFILFVFFWNFTKILLEFFGNSLRIFNLQGQRIIYIIKVSWLYTLLWSADILHSKSQLITKSCLNNEYGRNWFVCQDFLWKQKDENLDSYKCEASSPHFKKEINWENK